PAALRERERVRSGRAEIACARQVDAARRAGAEIELVHHRVAFAAQVEREQVATVRGGDSLPGDALDQRRLAWVLERLRIEPVPLEVVEPDLVAVAERADQVEAIARQRVERPRVSAENDLPL